MQCTKYTDGKCYGRMLCLRQIVQHHVLLLPSAWSHVPAVGYPAAHVRYDVSVRAKANDIAIHFTDGYPEKGANGKGP